MLKKLNDATFQFLMLVRTTSQKVLMLSASHFEMVLRPLTNDHLIIDARWLWLDASR